MGTQKCLQWAKDVMFWPGMAKQICDYVPSYSICLSNRNSNQKEPLTPHEIPSRPWQKLGSDLLEGKDCLFTVDYYSRYFEVDALPDTQSSTVIRKLKTHFARLGIPDVLHSDNAMQYASGLFQDFAKEWGFTHSTSSPLRPCSNGLAEETVGIVKNIFIKAGQSGKDPYIAILEYRNCPLECGYSPNQLLYSRKTKSILPITDTHFK